MRLVNCLLPQESPLLHQLTISFVMEAPQPTLQAPVITLTDPLPGITPPELYQLSDLAAWSYSNEEICGRYLNLSTIYTPVLIDIHCSCCCVGLEIPCL